MDAGLYNWFMQLIHQGNYETPAGKHLFKIAKSSLGKEMSPRDNAPDELGCVESFEGVVYKAFDEGTGSGLSTIRAKVAIGNSRKFVKVSSPIKGDVILCVTGEGIPKVSRGHIGIVGDTEDNLCGGSPPIYSNDSNTGLWSEHYTLDSWKKKFKEEGGYPIYYYRRLIF